MSNKIPPMPTGKHVSSAKKEPLSNLRRSSSASQLANHCQTEASLSEKNRILVSEVDRLKCLVHEKQNRISELDDENYQFRDYINRLEQEALRLKDSYDELEAKYSQAKFDYQKLQAEFNQLMDAQSSVVVDAEEQSIGVHKFFKYAQRIASDVNKMMQFKKYLNSSVLNLPSRPSILSNSINNCSLSNSFRQSSRTNRRSSLLIHDQNARRSKEESMPLTLTSTMEREEMFEKSAQEKPDEEEEVEEDESMREEDQSEETQVILDTQPSDNGLQAIEEESDCDQDITKAEHSQIIVEQQEYDEEKVEEEESLEEDVEEETMEETEEIEETVHSSEDEDNNSDNSEKTVHEIAKNFTYVINETHNVNSSFNSAANFCEPEKKSVKFDSSLDESGDHTKFVKTPFRQNVKPVVAELPKEESFSKKEKKSILKLRTSQGEAVSDRRESHKFADLEKEANQKSIFKTKKNTPQKKNDEVNKYLEDLVDEAKQNDKENCKNNNKIKKNVKTKAKVFSSSDSDNSDDDFVPKAKSKKKPTPQKVGLPPLPEKKSKRPLESVYEQKKVLKQTENIKKKNNLSQSDQSSEINEMNNSANNRSPTINTLLTKKLRLSPDSEDSIDTSQPIMGETGSARRARKAVSYKELPLNTKIRRDKDNRVCIKTLTCKISNPNEELFKK